MPKYKDVSSKYNISDTLLGCLCLYDNITVSFIMDHYKTNYMNDTVLVMQSKCNGKYFYLQFVYPLYYIQLSCYAQYQNWQNIVNTKYQLTILLEYSNTDLFRARRQWVWRSDGSYPALPGPQSQAEFLPRCNYFWLILDIYCTTINWNEIMNYIKKSKISKRSEIKSRDTNFLTLIALG